MLQGATFKVEPNDADWSRHCPVPPRAHDRRAGRAYARYRTSTSALICVLYSSENTSLVSCHMTVVFAVSLQSVPWAVCALAATTARFMVIHAAAAPQRAAAALENAHATHAAPLPPPPPPIPPSPLDLCRRAGYVRKCTCTCPPFARRLSTAQNATPASS
jgi:hypothetical protein